MAETLEESCAGAWTDEKHTSFLNWMEASFVSCVLFGGHLPPAAITPLPLDRCLPDDTDSTADSRAGKRTRRRTLTARLREGIYRGIPENTRPRNRLQGRRANQLLQDDQVVPEFEQATSRPNNTRPLHASEAIRPAATDKK